MKYDPKRFEVPSEIDEHEIKARLSLMLGSEFSRLIEVSGTDALGWYFPFHYAPFLK